MKGVAMLKQPFGVVSCLTLQCTPFAVTGASGGTDAGMGRDAFALSDAGSDVGADPSDGGESADAARPADAGTGCQDADPNFFCEDFDRPDQSTIVAQYVSPDAILAIETGKGFSPPNAFHISIPSRARPDAGSCTVRMDCLSARSNTFDAFSTNAAKVRIDLDFNATSTSIGYNIISFSNQGARFTLNTSGGDVSLSCTFNQEAGKDLGSSVTVRFGQFKTWHHVTILEDGLSRSISLTVDGDTQTLGFPAGSISTAAGPMRMSVGPNNTEPGTGTDFFIDDLRVRDIP
jgi:hypothetical protein